LSVALISYRDIQLDMSRRELELKISSRELGMGLRSHLHSGSRNYIPDKVLVVRVGRDKGLVGNFTIVIICQERYSSN
jgi:hypothetical protein